MSPQPWIVAGAVRGGIAVATFASTVALARLLNKDEFGAVALVLTAATLAGLVGVAGVPALLLRFRPEAQVRYGEGAAVTLSRWAFTRAFLALGVAATVAIAGGSWFLPSIEQAILLGLLTIGYGGTEFFLCLHQSHGRLIAAFAPRDIVWRPTAAALCAVLALALELSASLVLGVYASVLLLILFAQTLLGRARTSVATNDPTVLAEELGVPRAQGYYWLTTGVMAAQAHIDVVLVGLMLDPSATASYFAASRLALLVALPFQAINSLVGSRAAALLHGPGSAALAVFLRPVMAINVLSTCACALLLSQFVDPALMLFGGGYVDAGGILLVLLLAHVAVALLGPVGHLNMAGGGHKVMAMCTTLGVGLQVLLTVLLVPRLGGVGVAIAFAVAQLTWRGPLVLSAVRRTAVDPSVLGLIRSNPS